MTSTITSSAQSAASQAPGPAGSLVSGIQFWLSNLSSTIWNKFDQYFPPEKRQKWKQWLTKFATEKPYLASFLLSQIALSGPPLALFFIMTLTVAIFAIVVGLLVGLLGAVFFILLAVGFALFAVLPVLFFTTAAAVFVWLFGIGTYYIVKWFNEKEVPGIHTDVAGGLAKSSGLSDLPGMSNGEPLLNTDNQSSRDQQAPEKASRAEKDNSKGTGDKSKSSGVQHHSDSKDDSGSQQHQRKAATKSPSANKDSLHDVSNAADGVRKKVSV